jgi:hypothetical protein
MKRRRSLTTVAIGASTFACAALLSPNWTEKGGVSLSVEHAQARVGRPLTPVSVSGVARRHNRRAVYGAGVVAAGAAAVGTGAVVGAATSPYYAGGGYGSPYYGGPVRDARAAYYGGYPSAAPAAGAGLYGYNGWSDYQTRNGIKCTPGSAIKLDDGQMYVCQ